MDSAASFVYLDIRLKDYIGARFHLGAGYIRAYLANRGISSTQIIAPPTESLETLANTIACENPRLVGFTVFDRNFHLVRLLAKLVRERLPDSLIVAGGPTATFSYELLLSYCSSIDVCVIREGEETTFELLKPLLKGSKPDFARIPGLAIRSGTKVVLSAPKELSFGEMRNGGLDIFPSPYIERVIPPEEGPNVGIVTARGCPFRCSFCNFSAMSNHTVRYHTIERTIEELSLIESSVRPGKGRLRVEFLDDVFTVNRKRAREMCSAIASINLKHLYFWCETRADLVDKEMMYWLARAGVTEINFGLESADFQVLANIHKIRGGAHLYKEFLAHVRDAVTWAREFGIAPFVSLIFGLPGETPEIAHQTLNFIETLPLEGYSHNYLNIETGTELWGTHQDFGLSVSIGPQILPYRTTHAYDVFATVPVRGKRMSLERLTRNTHALRAAERLCGHISPSTENKPLQFLVVSTELTPKGVDCTWFRHATGPGTEITLMGQHMELGEYDKWLHFAYENDLPFFRANAAVNTGTETLLFDDFFGLQAGPEYGIRYVTEINEINQLNDDHERVIEFTSISIDNAPDHQAMEILQLAEKNIDILSQVLLNPTCRWSPRPCPAPSLSAAWIGIEGIRPCTPAPPLKTQALSVLRSKLAAEHEAECVRRGCRSCEVRDRCAKCLYTAPLTSEEYCSVQRRGHTLIAALTVELARILERTEHDGRKINVHDLRVSAVIPPGVRAFDKWETSTMLVGGKCGADSILYDVFGTRIWRVSETVFIVMECLAHSKLYETPTAIGICKVLETIGVLTSHQPEYGESSQSEP